MADPDLERIIADLERRQTVLERLLPHEQMREIATRNAESQPQDVDDEETVV